MQHIICGCGCELVYNLNDFQHHYTTDRFKKWVQNEFNDNKDKMIIKCGCGGSYTTKNQYNHYKMTEHKKWESRNNAYETVLYICPYCCFIFNYGKLAEHKAIAHSSK